MPHTFIQVSRDADANFRLRVATSCSTDANLSLCILAIRIDEWSRTLFPFAFAAFNVAYWSYYTIQFKTEEH